VSMRVGELVLLPAVRRASPDTLIVADGFSCREQIEQATSRRAVHLAEAIGGAIDGRRAAATEPAEEALLPRQNHQRSLRPAAAAALIAIGVAAAAAGLASAVRRSLASRQALRSG